MSAEWRGWRVWAAGIGTAGLVAILTAWAVDLYRGESEVRREGLKAQSERRLEDSQYAERIRERFTAAEGRLAELERRAAGIEARLLTAERQVLALEERAAGLTGR